MLKRVFAQKSLIVLTTLLFALLLLPAQMRAQSKRSLPARQAYKEKYKKLAIKKMQDYGIPASITLAQGMLESANGKSELAIKGNNHFGIKCHSDWTGPRIYHDDDKKQECFRKYKSVEQSYNDHSLFLRGTRRYASLFKLDPTDYKGWAKGLKKAGYATDPKYAKRLIEIIEVEGLANLDKGVEVKIGAPEDTLKKVEDGKAIPVSEEALEITLDGGHQIYERNRVQYIVVQPNDTYESLTRELNIYRGGLQKYNELPERKLPPPGSELYIWPKRRQAEAQFKVHVAEEGETMQSIAQRYAVKTSSLYWLNRMKPGTSIEAGQLIYLRQRKP